MQQPHPKVYYDDDKFQISIDCSKYKPEELDVKIEGNNIIITAKQEVVETGGKR
jgi:HSP20 family molecular chaperone IbpA